MHSPPWGGGCGGQNKTKVGLKASSPYLNRGRLYSQNKTKVGLKGNMWWLGT